MFGPTKSTCKQGWLRSRTTSGWAEHQPSLIAWIVFTVTISGLKQSEAIRIFCSPASTTQALFFYTFSSNYNDDSFPHSLMAPGGVAGLTTRADIYGERKRAGMVIMFGSWLANRTGMFKQAEVWKTSPCDTLTLDMFLIYGTSETDTLMFTSTRMCNLL